MTLLEFLMELGSTEEEAKQMIEDTGKPLEEIAAKRLWKKINETFDRASERVLYGEPEANQCTCADGCLSCLGLRQEDFR